MKTYKFGPLKIHRARNPINGYRFFYEIGLYLGPCRPRWLDKGAERVRRLFPYWLAVGLRDCDSGGRVTSWHPVFAWNYWSMRKATRAWYGAGDGEVWETLAPSEWLAWVFRRWKEARRGRVDQEY